MKIFHCQCSEPKRKLVGNYRHSYRRLDNFNLNFNFISLRGRIKGTARAIYSILPWTRVSAGQYGIYCPGRDILPGCRYCLKEQTISEKIQCGTVLTT